MPNDAADIVIDYDRFSYRKEANEFLHNLPRYTREYIVSLLPIATWIHRYNLFWLVSDLIAGVTVGVVVVPQGMGYAKIALLPPEYGLYTAFVGLCVYCLFATSKDISIGPTAVMSLLLGQTVTKVTAEHPEVTAQQIAVAFSLLTGAIAMFIGLVRLGVLVDLIPGPVIAGFMTGSSITITLGQLPKLFGIKGVNTQDSPYLILGNFFKNLPKTKVDVAFGLVGLFWLYGIRYLCSYLTRRYPHRQMLFFFISIARNGVLVIFGTLIAYLINIGKTTSPISILKNVPAGFQAMAVPHVEASLIGHIASSLPSGVIILILEHIAIAKSFGRINDYVINPNQEIVAIGFTNIWAAFFGAYPSTGSFSRTAIKSRSGVKTPIAGIFSGLVIILALYALTPAFYYIPDALLAAVVIHAVADLISGPSYVKRLYSVSVVDLAVFAVAVIVTFFTTVEYGIYASVGLAALVLFFRLARPRFYSLGRIPLLSQNSTNEKETSGSSTVNGITSYLYVPEDHPVLRDRVRPLPRGILLLRVDQAFTYPNAAFIADSIIAVGKERTRRFAKITSKGQRMWNDGATEASEALRADLPRLHAVIFDFASVSRIDASGLQALVDAQNTLNRYADHHVEFHFVNIPNPSVRATLVVAGFGTQPRSRLTDEISATSDESHNTDLVTTTEVLPVVPNSKDGPHYLQEQLREQVARQLDEESRNEKYSQQSGTEYGGPIHIPKDRYPFFHWSTDDAIRAAEETAAGRTETVEAPAETEADPTKSEH